MRFITTIILLSTAVLLNACNTIEGVGKDVKAGGKKLENTAHQSKPSNHPHTHPHN